MKIIMAFGIVLIFLVVGFSGCSEEKNDESNLDDIFFSNWIGNTDKDILNLRNI